jgi:hypothetical protein
VHRARWVAAACLALVSSSCSQTHQAKQDTGGISPANPPANSLDWRYIGTLPVEGRHTIDARAYDAWAHTQHLTPDQAGAGGALWSGRVPGGANAAVVQVWALSGGPMHVVGYFELRGVGRVVDDLVLKAGTRSFTERVSLSPVQRVTLDGSAARISG